MQERPMLVEKEIRIGGYDIDAMGIVSNIVYVRWFEDLRMAILDKYYPYTQMMALSVSPILLKTEIEYKAALTIYDRPTGRCWMNRMSKSRWEMGWKSSRAKKSTAPERSRVFLSSGEKAGDASSEAPVYPISG
jgi:acyl-CoA thioester hydrolase